MTKKNTLPALMLLVMSMLTVISTHALDIPAGTFYYDNSLTKYATVKFIYGSYSNAESYIVTMTHEGDNLWSITMPEAVPGMYRYCFSETVE